MKRSFKMFAMASMISFAAACGGDDTDVNVEPSTDIPASPAPAPVTPDTMPDSMTHADTNMVSTGL